jgi:hypothetical protein
VPKYAIEYQQTTEERYDSDMNERAREVVETIDPEAGESGGCAFFGEEPRAEQAFYVNTTPDQAENLRATLSDLFEREVTLTARAVEREGS